MRLLSCEAFPDGARTHGFLTLIGRIPAGMSVSAPPVRTGDRQDGGAVSCSPMARVLLLNPPADRIVLRDSWCSKRSKSGYLYHPVDLMTQGGILAGAGARPVLLDALAERLTGRETRSRIELASPDLIYALAARANLADDVAFLRGLAATGVPLVVGGDVALRAPRALFSLIPRAAGFLADFTSDALVRMLSGAPPSRALLRPGDPGPAAPEPGGERPFGIPDWPSVPRGRYLYPFARHADPATVLTASGCGLACAYCASGAFPWRHRPLDEVCEEFALLRSLRYREIYFADQTFNRDPGRTAALLERMTRGRFGFSFSAFVRLDRLDDDLLDLFSAAGCHTLIAGIESGDPDLRARHGKPLEEGALAGRIRAIRSRGMRAVGTFLFGLPGDTPDAARRSADLAVSLGLDFASFNVFVPRTGTPLHDGSAPTPADQSYGDGGPAARLVRAANRRFYLRPSYLLRRLLALRTVDQFKIELSQATGLFSRSWKKK